MALPALGLLYGAMPLFLYRCPKTGYRVQGFSPDDVTEDRRVYEPMTCPVCQEVHMVNPATGKVLGEPEGKAQDGNAAPMTH